MANKKNKNNKLNSRLTGEDAIIALGGVLEQITEIIADNEISKAFEEEKSIKAIGIACRKYPTEIIKVMANLNGEDFESYARKVNVLTLPKKLIEFTNSKEGTKLFSYRDSED